MGKTSDIGNRGELLVAEYLKQQGYSILETQYRCRLGEVDLIARKGNVLSFVEVKTRSNLNMGLPREFVTAKKQRRITLAASRYLMHHHWEGEVSFDVAEVYLAEGKPPRIEYIPQAFMLL